MFILKIGIKVLFKNLKNISNKDLLWTGLVLIFLIGFFCFISISINGMSRSNQNIFAYTVQVRDTVEQLDKIFERAEVNVNVMVDSISNSYDASRQQDRAYNIHFIDGINGLIKSVLSNSPSVDGSWFQINADLPFSAQAYNWYEFKEDQFIDVKSQFAGTLSMDRKITPEDDPYYFNAIATQKPVWSDIYKDADTKEAMITISTPIYKEGTLVGVVGIDISIKNLQQILEYMQAALGKSELYLLDKKNKVILSQTTSNPYAPKDYCPSLDLFNENKEGPVEYYDHLVKKTAIKLTLSNDYNIIIAIENKVLFTETHQIIPIIYILFALLIISTVTAFVNHFKIIDLNQSIKEAKETADLEAVQQDRK